MAIEAIREKVIPLATMNVFQSIQRIKAGNEGGSKLKRNLKIWRVGMAQLQKSLS
jgi:hypothetical protein